jgi:hypothetical protein
MTTFVKAFSDLLALLLQAMRLSAVLPATLFVILNAIFVLPQFEGTEFYDILQKYALSFSINGIIVFSILLISYSLMVLNIPIIRLFEGYPFLTCWLGRQLRQSHQHRMERIKSSIALLDENIQKCQEQEKKPLSSEGIRGRRRQYEIERNLLVDELALTYPQHQVWRTLPTQLGNVIAAAEEYPSHLYEMDSVTLWPYLTPILTKEGYAPFIEKEKSIFDFLLNMTVLILLFGVELAYVGLLLYGLQWQAIILPLGLTITVAFGFYKLSIQGALGWGFTIRTAFVLYRGHLRKQLGLKRPKTHTQERVLWRKTSVFFRDHARIQGDLIFDYKPEKADQDKAQSESTAVNITSDKS